MTKKTFTRRKFMATTAGTAAAALAAPFVRTAARRAA